MEQKAPNTSSYAIIMVTYNRGEVLARILKSISNYQWAFKNFVIVNNCSTDSTSEVLEQYASKHRLSVINSAENVGHGAGLAMALKHLNTLPESPEYIVFLEDDSIPDAGLISFSLDRIKTSDYDLLSPAGNRVRLGKRENITPRADEILSADFCLLDGAVLRYEVVAKAGYPVEDWFMMVDDYEYCVRMRKHGFKLGVIANPFHEIMHLGGGGGFTRATMWRGYYQMRNHVFFLKRYFSWFYLLDFVLLQTKRTLAGITPPDRLPRTRLRLLGLWHGIIGKKGRTLDPETLRF